MAVFGSSLVLILFLFALKHVEARRGARFAESTRIRADEGALRVKHIVHLGEWYLEQAPWFLGALTRYSIHVGALGYARLARTSAEYAHALADLVSHKHRFERRETKSQYLRQVSDLPRRTQEPVAEPAPAPVIEATEPEVGTATEPRSRTKRKPKKPVATS